MDNEVTVLSKCVVPSNILSGLSPQGLHVEKEVDYVHQTAPTALSYTMQQLLSLVRGIVISQLKAILEKTEEGERESPDVVKVARREIFHGGAWANPGPAGQPQSQTCGRTRQW